VVGVVVVNFVLVICCCRESKCITLGSMLLVVGFWYLECLAYVFGLFGDLFSKCSVVLFG